MGCIHSPPEDTVAASAALPSSGSASADAAPMTAYERFLQEHNETSHVKAAKRQRENTELIDWWVKFCQRMFSEQLSPAELLVYVVSGVLALLS